MAPPRRPLAKRPSRAPNKDRAGPAPTASAFPTATSEAHDPSYPVLSAAEVLLSMVALSREVTADMDEAPLFELFYRTLGELLPNRLIALRRFEPRTFRVTDLLAPEGLVDAARDMPPTISKSALEYPNVLDKLPLGGDGGISVVDHQPLVFRDAVAGFAVPLVAGGELTGEVQVNYRPIPGGRRRMQGLPLRQDKALVIPIANYVAVVAHTRRLLRETAYLQDYLEQLIDQATVLIIATDLDGRVTVWNHAMNRLTGFSRAQAVGRELLPWLSELGASDVALVMKQVGASGETATREVRLPSEGGAVLRGVFNVVTIRGHGGRPAAVLAMGQDVTALRSLQSQVIHAEKLATVGQIAAGVAHEINNPLTSIQVCAEAVLRKAQYAVQGRTPNAFEAPDVDRIKKIVEGAERIRRFARDLVSYARPSGTEVDQVSLNDVIDQGVSFCEHILADVHAGLERDLNRALPPIRAIRDQLLQVVINLITNAAHALGDRGGTIRVRTWTAGEAAVSMAVSDTGSGIKDDDRAYIFDPFFTTKAAGRGTGLGLSVVRNIIYAHGGQISFQTRPGSGTTFVVTLPINHVVSPDNVP